MTTITIKESIKNLPKTEFETQEELYVYLKKELSPVSIFLVNDEDIPESILSSLKQAKEEGEDDVVDFKG